MKAGSRLTAIAASMASPCVLFVFLAFVISCCTLNGVMGNDEGMWSYMGRIWIENHMPPYVGSVENKTPGIFELFAVSHFLFGTNFTFARVLGVAAILLSALVVYSIGKRLHSHPAGIFSMAIFGLTMSSSLLDGWLTAQTETFMVLGTTLSFYFVLRAAGSPRWKLWLCLSGLSIGLAIAFKQVALTSVFALLVFLFLCPGLTLSLREKAIGVLLTGLGIVAATVISLVPLLISNVSLRDYIDGAWLILLNRGSSAGSIAVRASRLSDVLSSYGVIAYCVFFLILLIKSRLVKSGYLAGLLVWMVCDCIGASASGCYFGHQLKQVVPSASLLIGMSLGNILRNRIGNNGAASRYTSAVLVCLVILFLPYDCLTAGVRSSRSGYPDSNEVAGAWLRKHTGTNDYVYVAPRHGNPILSYSGRLAPSRYFNTIFVTGQAEKKTLLSDLKARPPLYFVGSPDMPVELARFVADNYTLLPKNPECAELAVYELKPPPPAP